MLLILLISRPLTLVSRLRMTTHCRRTTSLSTLEGKLLGGRDSTETGRGEKQNAHLHENRVELMLRCILPAAVGCGLRVVGEEQGMRYRRAIASDLAPQTPTAA